MVSNVEHVVREGQRRGDMAGKYNILELMLTSSGWPSLSEVPWSTHSPASFLYLILNSSGSVVFCSFTNRRRNMLGKRTVRGIHSYGLCLN